MDTPLILVIASFLGLSACYPLSPRDAEALEKRQAVGEAYQECQEPVGDANEEECYQNRNDEYQDEDGE
jgi:hypothetical protein